MPRMTLDEAIAHAKEVAEGQCGECALQHAQLAEWLEELKTLLEFKQNHTSPKPGLEAKGCAISIIEAAKQRIKDGEKSWLVLSAWIPSGKLLMAVEDDRVYRDILQRLRPYIDKSDAVSMGGMRGDDSIDAFLGLIHAEGWEGRTFRDTAEPLEEN